MSQQRAAAALTSGFFDREIMPVTTPDGTVVSHDDCIRSDATPERMARDRYSLVPDEVAHYVMGHYGPLHGAVAPDVLDRVLAVPGAAEIARWERPQPSLSDIRALWSAGMPDEELLLRFMTSDVEVDAMIAAGPIRTSPDTSSARILRHLDELATRTPQLTAVSVTSPDMTVSREPSRDASSPATN